MEPTAVNMPPGVIAIFWSAAKKLRIGGFVKEVKTAGHIDVPEQEIRFEEHVFMVKEGTDKASKAKAKAEMEFIRHYRNFDSAECKEVSSLREANMLTLGQQARKNEVQNVPIPVNAEPPSHDIAD